MNTTFDKFESGLRSYENLDKNILNKLLEFIHSYNEESLCHGDFHPENIMVEKEGNYRVIDWIDAYNGPPLSDVARTYYLLTRIISPKNNIIINQIENIVTNIIASNYLRGYFAGKCIPDREFSIWTLIILICRFRENIEEEKPFLKKSISS